jgi:hypothetical protein
LLKNWSLLLFDCAGNIFHPSMASDLKNLTDSPSNLTHLDVSGVGMGIGAAELAAHLLSHPVSSQSGIFESMHVFFRIFQKHQKNMYSHRH